MATRDLLGESTLDGFGVGLLLLAQDSAPSN